MEWIVVAIIAVAALICPAMMLGPMLLQRLGLRKGASTSSMSCMMMSGGGSAPGDQLEGLRRRRAVLDEEIAVTRILADGAARRIHHGEDSAKNTSANGGAQR